MYDIKSLNIWKVSSNLSVLRGRDKVLEIDVSREKETDMSKKCQEVFNEILLLVPTARFSEIKKSRGKLKFPIYINETLRTTELDALELSVRSSNCLHRAGYTTIGELVESIDSCEDLKKIRNCGTKSIDEIMSHLFCYQYSQLNPKQKLNYIYKVLEYNS